MIIKKKMVLLLFLLILITYLKKLNKKGLHIFECRENVHLLSRYFCEEERLKSFRGWPVSFIRPADLAKSGFIYAGSADVVRCVFCL